MRRQVAEFEYASENEECCKEEEKGDMDDRESDFGPFPASEKTGEDHPDETEW